MTTAQGQFQLFPKPAQGAAPSRLPAHRVRKELDPGGAACELGQYLHSLYPVWVTPGGVTAEEGITRPPCCSGVIWPSSSTCWEEKIVARGPNIFFFHRAYPPLLWWKGGVGGEQAVGRP